MAGLRGTVGNNNGRNRTIDMLSEGPVDMEYQRVVREIQEQAAGAGWLFGRGAMDKQDLIYLRDHADRERNMEISLMQGETAEFAALRKRAEELPDDAELRIGGSSLLHGPAASAAAVASVAAVSRAKDKSSGVGKLAIKLVAVPKGSKAVTPKQTSQATAVGGDGNKHSSSAGGGDAPNAKRLKLQTDGGTGAGDGVGVEGSRADNIRQPVSGTDSADATPLPTATAADEEESGPGLLLGLGGYGSDSDDDHDADNRGAGVDTGVKKVSTAER